MMEKKQYRILFLGLNRAPPHNEAWSKRINDCSLLLGGVVLTTGQVRPIMKRQQNYIIVNSKIGYFILPFYYAIIQHFIDLTIIEQRPDSLYGILISFLMYFRIFKAKKCSYRFSIEWMRDKYTSDLGMRIFFKHVLPKLKFVFAVDKRTECYLSTLISKDKVHFVTGINLADYQEYDISSSSDFKVMFASSPLNPKPDAFKEKGVDIILKAFRNIISSSDKPIIKLSILWRCSPKSLTRLLSELGIQDYVDIYSSFANVEYLLRDSHIVIFTPRSLTHSTHYPHSIMESLAVGRPVIVTNNLEISDIIKREKCGIVIKPSAKDLAEAINLLSNNYFNYQRNCRRVAEEFFDLKKNLESWSQEIV